MRRALMALAGLALVVVAWLVWDTFDSARGDVRRQQRIYDQFELFPGARKIDSSSYQLRGDGRPTGHYGFQVTYELPATATAAEVISFYRANVPAGWTVATDATCAAQIIHPFPPPTASTLVPGPPPTAPQHLVLIEQSSTLTVFTPGHAPSDGAVVEGVRFQLERNGAAKLLVADAPMFACGAPETDRRAERFDQEVP